MIMMILTIMLMKGSINIIVKIVIHCIAIKDCTPDAFASDMIVIIASGNTSVIGDDILVGLLLQLIVLVQFCNYFVDDACNDEACGRGGGWMSPVHFISPSEDAAHDIRTVGMASSGLKKYIPT
jgi:hypothetical protein